MFFFNFSSTLLFFSVISTSSASRFSNSSFIWKRKVFPIATKKKNSFVQLEAPNFELETFCFSHFRCFARGFRSNLSVCRFWFSTFGSPFFSVRVRSWSTLRRDVSLENRPRFYENDFLVGRTESQRFESEFSTKNFPVGRRRFFSFSLTNFFFEKMCFVELKIFGVSAEFEQNEVDTLFQFSFREFVSLRRI